MSNHITEIVPDLDKMPAWAREAFEAGQFFDAAFKRVAKLEAKLEAIGKWVAQEWLNTASPARMLNDIEVLLKENSNE